MGRAEGNEQSISERSVGKWMTEGYMVLPVDWSTLAFIELLQEFNI